MGPAGVVGVEDLDPAGLEVAEEVLADVPAGELAARRVVEGAAGDRAFGRVPVDGGAETPVRGGPVVGGGPAVVGPGDALVDLLVGAADVVDEEAAGAGLDG